MYALDGRRKYSHISFKPPSLGTRFQHIVISFFNTSTCICFPYPIYLWYILLSELNHNFSIAFRWLWGLSSLLFHGYRVPSLGYSGQGRCLTAHRHPVPIEYVELYSCYHHMPSGHGQGYSSAI